jgi:hypothetical protein
MGLGMQFQSRFCHCPWSSSSDHVTQKRWMDLEAKLIEEIEVANKETNARVPAS